MKIPHWLNNYLNDEDLQRISQAVVKAEKRTSGEIVPMVVSQSSTTGHVPLLVALSMATIFFSMDLWTWQLEYFGLSGGYIAVADLLLFFLFTRLISSLPTVQRVLTPRQDQNAQVETRAINEFYNHRLHHTEAATGILIFISMLEHKAIVLGDEPIAQKLPQEKWQGVVDLLLKDVKNKNMGQGFCNAIDSCGEILAEHFPIQENDVNELRNQLIIKD